MKVSSSEIQRYLIRFVNGSGDIVIPNYYYGSNECDLFRLTPAGIVYEYEIKISRADFFNDFKKLNGKKHSGMKDGSLPYCPNRFVFVVPEGLVSKEEVPPYAGLIYYSHEWFNWVRSGKMLHKNKFGGFNKLAQNLSSRCMSLNSKVNMLRNYEHEKEVSNLNRYISLLESTKKEYQHLLFTNNIKIPR